MKRSTFKTIAFLSALLIFQPDIFAQTSISAVDAKKHIGETLSVCGKVFSANFLNKSRTRPTLLNIGGDYPNQMVTVMIPMEYRKNFTIKPEEYFVNKAVCVTGKIVDYKGKPEIIISSPSEIVLEADFTNRQILPDEPDSPINPTSAGEAQYTITLTNTVNLRAEPSLSGSIITVVSTGTKVNIYKSENGWSYVSVGVFNKTLQKVVIEYGYIKNTVLK